MKTSWLEGKWRMKNEKEDEEKCEGLFKEKRAARELTGLGRNSPHPKPSRYTVDEVERSIEAIKLLIRVRDRLLGAGVNKLVAKINIHFYLGVLSRCIIEFHAEIGYKIEGLKGISYEKWSG